MISAVTPKLGDYFVVNTHSDVSAGIEFAEYIADGFKKSPWTHAGVCVGRSDQSDTTLIVEAMPHGAQLVEWHYDGYNFEWSTGGFQSRYQLSQKERLSIAGTATQLAHDKIGYSYLDYEALALYKLRIRFPYLRDYVESSGHLICSQLVDYCYQKAGVQLFDDKRWNGYVMPSSLGFLLA